MIRILHVDSERPWRGGQNQVLLLMRRQRARGDDPHLAAPGEAALSARASAEGFPIHPVAMRGTWDLASVRALAGVMRGLLPEVVHWHAARAHAIGAMASVLAPDPARVLSRRVEFPVRGSLGSRLLYSIPIDRVAAISNAVREALVRSGVEANLIDVVPSGIDPAPEADPLPRAEVRGRLGCGAGEVVGIVVSALSPGKGHGQLLRAMASAAPRAPNLRLWIAGYGPLAAGLKVELRALGLEATVAFLGFRTDVPALLRSADFFCLPTRSEGLGSSILEAMSAGLPVVASRVGGVPEVVEDGRTGALVPLDDVAALADWMVRMATDADLRRSMGESGAVRARAFSADRTAEGTYQVYQRALEARRDRRGRG